MLTEGEIRLECARDRDCSGRDLWGVGFWRGVGFARVAEDPGGSSPRRCQASLVVRYRYIWAEDAAAKIWNVMREMVQ